MSPAQQTELTKTKKDKKKEKGAVATSEEEGRGKRIRRKKSLKKEEDANTCKKRRKTEKKKTTSAEQPEEFSPPARRIKKPANPELEGTQASRRKSKARRSMSGEDLPANPKKRDAKELGEATACTKTKPRAKGAASKKERASKEKVPNKPKGKAKAKPSKLDKIKHMAGTDDAKAEKKKALSRKSAAYHKAYKQAKEANLEESQARAKAKEVPRLGDRCLICSKWNLLYFRGYHIGWPPNSFLWK